MDKVSKLVLTTDTEYLFLYVKDTIADRSS